MSWIKPIVLNPVVKQQSTERQGTTSLSSFNPGITQALHTIKRVTTKINKPILPTTTHPFHYRTVLVHQDPFIQSTTPSSGQVEGTRRSSFFHLLHTKNSSHKEKLKRQKKFHRKRSKFTSKGFMPSSSDKNGSLNNYVAVLLAKILGSTYYI